jgi:TonB family protein
MTETWKQWEGQVVNGEFPLLQYLGGSDHSAVFLTQRDGRDPYKAAIKLIPADPENAQSQLFQWRLATKLPHPHLLRIFETGRCELGETQLLYLVMEYAEEDLSQILPQRALTPAETREMLQPALDALAYVHGKGFVHGHLKPANIMAVADQVKLSSDSLHTAGESGSGARTLRGMTAYSPPEAASGRISPAADVWSLGVTLVEVLTGRRLTWDGAKKEDPAVPKEVPEPFFEIARHCLRLDPHRRYTVTAITAHLKPVPSEPVPAPRTSGAKTSAPITPGLKKASSTRLYLVPAAAVGLALLLWAGSSMRSSHPQALPEEAQPAPAASPEKLPVQPKAKPTPATRAATRGTDDSTRSTSTSPAAAPQSALRAQAAGKRSSGAVVPGTVLHQVVPDVPQSARDTITGKVRVRVKVAVDASGNVKEATLDLPGPSKYFARLAMHAAQGWKFTPAQVNGHNAPSEWILRFAFARAATEVYPVQVAP